MARLYLREGVWHYDITVPSTGKRVRKSLHTTDETEARMLLEDVLEEYSMTEESNLTLAGLISKYEDPSTNPRYKTARITGQHYGAEYANAVAFHSKEIHKLLKNEAPRLLGKPLRAITPVDIRTIRLKVYEGFGATRKAQYAFRTFKAMFTQAVYEGWIDSNPAALQKDIHYEEKHKEFIDPCLFRRLIDMKDEFRDVRAWGFFAIAATTGMRRSEVLALNRSQIFQGTITVDRALKDNDQGIGEPKWGVIRVFPLSDYTQWILSQLKPYKDGRYFHVNRRWGDEVMRGIKASAVKLFPKTPEMKGLTAHVLRHSINTALLSKGLAEAFVSEYLGWNHQEMLVMQQRYTHLKSEHLRCVADAIDDIYGYVPPEMKNVFQFKKA